MSIQYFSRLNIFFIACIDWFLDVTLRLSDQDGLGQEAIGSGLTGWRRLWKSSNTQSMIRMMRCGGRPNLRMVAGEWR